MSLPGLSVVDWVAEGERDGSKQEEVVTSTGVVLPELCAGVSDWVWGMDTGWREGTCVLNT